MASGLPSVPWITPSEAAVGALPPVCALALPDIHEPPNAAASAAFAVDRNNCHRFILISSVGLAYVARRTQRNPMWLVVVSIACGYRAAGR